MLDHLDDIASDLSAFHRVDDLYDLDGPTFFRLAFRLAAYAGVMQARVRAEMDTNQPPPAQAPDVPYATAPAPARAAAAPAEVNPGTQATLQADPAFAGLISFG